MAVKSACLVQVEARLQIWLWKDGMLAMCVSGEVSMLGAGAGIPAGVPQPHVL